MRLLGGLDGDGVATKAAMYIANSPNAIPFSLFCEPGNEGVPECGVPNASQLEPDRDWLQQIEGSEARRECLPSTSEIRKVTA